MIVKLFIGKKHSWLVFLSLLLTVVFLLMKSAQADPPAQMPIQAQQKQISRARLSRGIYRVNEELQHALWEDLGPEVIQNLLKKEVNLSLATEVGKWQPLHIAAQETSYPEVIHLLLSAGADPHTLDDMGASPFLLAAGFNKNPEVIKALADKSNVHLVDDKGLNAFHLALMHKQSLEIIMVLEQAGVDPLVEDSMGRTPLRIAEEHQKGIKANIAYLQGITAIRMVQQKGKCPALVKQLAQINGR